MKKYLFSTHSYLLLAMAAILLFASCNFQKSEKEIRAQVEKELMLKYDSLLQTPKHILSPGDMRLVIENFKNIELQKDIETTICKLPNGTVISVLDEKKTGVKIFAQYEDIKKEALIEAAIPMAFLPPIYEKIKIKPDIRFVMEIPQIDCNNEDASRRACVEGCIRIGFTSRYCETMHCKQCLRLEVIGGIIKSKEELGIPEN